VSVQVGQTPGGSWRWRYVDPPPGHDDAGARADLANLDDHETAAYPDVPVVVVPAPETRASTSRTWTGRVVLAVVVVLALRRGSGGGTRAGSRRV
jgi:hypothetical protein